MADPDVKARVRAHWEGEVCGTRDALPSDTRVEFFRTIDRRRYAAVNMLPAFADFPSARGRRVLEVGLGTGSDFCNWVRSGAEAYGRDLTEASVDLVKERLALEGFDADIRVGDAEALDLPDDFADLYYSWGVLHHTPNPEAALAEAHRVLKPGGDLKIMLYHYPSVVAGLLWLQHGPLRGNMKSAREICAEHLESPGTKLFTVREARDLVGRFFVDRPVEIHTHLGSGDLLTHTFSEKYRGAKWKALRRIYPRWFIRCVLGNRFGMVMTIHSVK